MTLRLNFRDCAALQDQDFSVGHVGYDPLGLVVLQEEGARVIRRKLSDNAFSYVRSPANDPPPKAVVRRLPAMRPGGKGR